ncbi:MAG TPA: DUF551 domain-containing protein [Polyangiaceae bacterium]|nr:DUF551 domain-containing protein [Polyangiaceae bacterium]
MSKRAPKRIWLEIWPERAHREDSVHYQRTGYGHDLASSATSRIVEYERSTVRSATSAWVSTRERFPKAGIAVLCIGHDWEDPVVLRLVVSKGKEPQLWTDPCSDGATYYPDDVTHWMPLPEKP